MGFDFEGLPPQTHCTKAGLKRELQRVWREEITKEVCQNCIRHYFMLGGTLDRCIAANGRRFSKGALHG